MSDWTSGTGEPVLIFFGESWNSPVLDGATQVPTPVGEACFNCVEPIVDGDQGVITPYVRERLAPSFAPMHADCFLIGIVGHWYGVCSCNGYDISTRAAARRLWDVIMQAEADTDGT